MISGHTANFHPFAPRGWGNPLSSSGTGILGAAASIFFAYVGFDAVSTAAEETKNPQRNVPIGLIGSLLICTVFYLLVAGGVIGAFGAQPLMDPATGIAFKEGSPELYASAACQAAHAPTVCSKEALAHILREVSNPLFGNLVGLAAAIALPSVVLLMMYGQTRIFFVMARDGLLPERLSAVHQQFRTPYIVTIVTGIFVAIAAAFLPVGTLADYSNAGTLFAFAAVSLGVMILRRRDPSRPRPFRTPAIFVVAPLSIAGCLLLFVNLNVESKLLFVVVDGARPRGLLPLRLSPQPRCAGHCGCAGTRGRCAGIDRNCTDATGACAAPGHRRARISGYRDRAAIQAARSRSFAAARSRNGRSGALLLRRSRVRDEASLAPACDGRAVSGRDARRR